MIEGHVPAREIQRLLSERPSAVGLAVPGMPIGSPGMDGPVYGTRKDPYDVLLVRKDGSTTSYQSYRMKIKTMDTTLKTLVAALATALLVPLDWRTTLHHKPAAAASAPRNDRRRGAQDRSRASRRCTLKHADIKSLDMPAMTMVFLVKDKAMLDKLKTGDKIKFKVVNDSGKFTLSRDTACEVDVAPRRWCGVGGPEQPENGGWRALRDCE